MESQRARTTSRDLRAYFKVAYKDFPIISRPGSRIEERKGDAVLHANLPTKGAPTILEENEVLEKGTAVIDLREQPDSTIVDWDGPNDPANPQNWSAFWKASNIVVLSAMTLITPLASSMFAPGVPELMKEFDSDSTLLATFVVSVYLLGFAFGPLLIAPLSELYGRVVMYHICNIGYLVFTIACAYAPTLSAMIGFRFLQGCWGVAPLTIGKIEQ